METLPAGPKYGLKQYLDADLAAHGLTSWRWHFRFTKPELHFQRRLRRAEDWSNRQSPLAQFVFKFLKLRLLQSSLQTGISIPPGVFGPGLAVAHHGSVVVNSKARVGSDCRIHSGTNIGSTPAGVPTIGDNVYIGPGAVIFGPITIGSNSVIGANSVVNRDVPPGVTVGGTPARVISSLGAERIHPAIDASKKIQILSLEEGGRFS
jgi:serine O-acetyltransferase